MADTTRQVLEELKKRFTHQEVLDLTNPEERRHPDWPNVGVTYMSFFRWLKVFHEEMNDPEWVASAGWKNPTKSLPWNALINSYRFQRDDHLGRVIEHLGQIHASQARKVLRTGTALRDEIAANRPRRILLVPYEKVRIPGQTFNSRVISDKTGGCRACGYRANLPALDSEGEPNKQLGIGRGIGTSTFIGYSPRFFGKHGTSDLKGVGFKPDEVLYHELVHASRLMRGVFHMAWASPPYNNEEEYLAVVITNIYLSEKGAIDLRAGHVQGTSVLTTEDQRNFLDNPQLVKPSPRDLLASFKRWQQQFFEALARIGPRWPVFNPVRKIKEEAKP